MAYSSTIIVTCNSPGFHHTLNELNLTGSQVGSLIHRWAVEVPFGKEDEYAKILQQNSIVNNVQTHKIDKKYIKTRNDNGKKRS